jgi:hypothetical protein
MVMAVMPAINVGVSDEIGADQHQSTSISIVSAMLQRQHTVALVLSFGR